MRYVRPLLCFFLALDSVNALAAGPQMVKGHVPDVVAKGLAPKARLEATQQLHLAIGLPVRDAPALDQAIKDLYNPASPNYRKFLTPAQFTARFGPADKDYQAVQSFAKAHHLTVTATYPGRTLLDVRGAVADVEKAFHVTMNVYQHPTEARTFFAPDVEPTLDLDTPVSHIGGLSDFALPHPSSLHSEPAGLHPAAQPNAGSQSGYYVGLDFRAAYAPGVTLNGAGQSVALVEFDTYYPGDVSKYINLGTSGLSGATATVIPVGIDESTNTTPGNGNDEVSLDIDMVISMAPGLSNLFVYEAPNNSTAPDDLFTALTTNTAVAQISSSWSGFSDSTVHQAFQTFTMQGQSFFIASGDSGACLNPQSPPSPPVDDIYATSVGGTTLGTTGPKGAWTNETTWSWFTSGFGTGTNATSGGISPTYAIPSWQEGVNMTANQGSSTFRNIPDVALAGDQIFIYGNNGSGQIIGGTSAAAPLWAGFMALVNQQNTAVGNPPLGFFNPTLYALAEGTNYAACFHDITIGNNTNFISPNAFYSTPGYDLCTGWGTPNGSNLIAVLAAPLDVLEIFPLNGFTTSGAAGGPIRSVTQVLTLTNAGTNALSWSLYNPAAWLTAAPTNGVLAAGAFTSVTVSLDTAVAITLPVGMSSTNIWITNGSDGIAQSRSFNLTLVGAQVVQNGGFEAGDFTSWVFNGIGGSDNFVGDNASLNIGSGHHPDYVGHDYIHSGTYAAFMGQPGDLATLSQTLITAAGQAYLLSCWLLNPGEFANPMPNEFSVTWNGNVLFDQANLPKLASTNLQFVVMAASSSTVVSFGFRNDNDYFGFDDVTATLIPQPSFQTASESGGSVLLTWSATTNVTYQLQYTTALLPANWIDVGSPVAATGGVVSATDAVPTDPQRFYRVIIVTQ